MFSIYSEQQCVTFFLLCYNGFYIRLLILINKSRTRDVTLKYVRISRGNYIQCCIELKHNNIFVEPQNHHHRYKRARSVGRVAGTKTIAWRAQWRRWWRRVHNNNNINDKK